MALPWKEVAALPFAQVAARIHQDHPFFASDDGVRWPCPRCERRLLSIGGTGARARCTGCGGAFSTIDVAAAVLRRADHAACHWLAQSFGLLDALPWREVNDLPGIEVAEVLRDAGFPLQPAPREKLKWRCPTGCGSSDAFHTFRASGRRSRCYSCGATLTNVDLSARQLGTAPADACRWLAVRFGLALPVNTGPVVHGQGVPLVASKPAAAQGRDRESLWNELRSAGATLPPAVYSGILDRTRLSPRGVEYLASRRIPAAGARATGFRSVDGPAEWTRLRKHLADTHTERELFVAGFPLDRKGKVKLPFAGLLPMLLIPYRQGGELVSLRWRTIGPPPGRLLAAIPDWNSKDNRYRSLTGAHAQPPVPYNADARVGSVLHWVEGEMNALTLSLPPYRQHAEGFPGADAWNDAWLEHPVGVCRLVVWYDEDASGRAARERVTKKLSERHGDAWVLRRLRHVHTPPGKDANALHVEGTLAPIIRAAAWMGPPAPADSR